MALSPTVFLKITPKLSAEEGLENTSQVSHGS